MVLQMYTNGLNLRKVLDELLFIRLKCSDGRNLLYFLEDKAHANYCLSKKVAEKFRVQI